MDKPTVATPSREYNAASARWPMVRALMGSTAAMREAGQLYLPKEAAESQTAYTARLARSTLFNGLGKTVKDMAGKVFAKPILLEDDVPAEIEEYAENIDLAGRNLDAFSRDVFEDGLQTGISFVLVDMPPPLPEGATLADEKSAGTRPYFCHIKAEALIGWQSETIAGKETLTQVRIRECVQELDPENPWEKMDVEQIRVLEPGAWQVWRQVKVDGREEWVKHSEGTTSIDSIPLAPFYACRTGFMTGRPPLQDLADLNVAHWQSASDQRNILHVARVPILFGSGFNGDDAGKFVVGANSLTFASDAAAKLTFVEHTGAAIGSGRDDLKDLELQMQVMGLELLLPTPGAKTATEDAADTAVMNSSLAAMADALKDCIEGAFGFMAEYAGLGEDAGGQVVVNKDYGAQMRDSADLVALKGALDSNAITKLTYLEELKRRGVLSDSVDAEEEAAKAANEAPDLMGDAMSLGAGPGGPEPGDDPPASGASGVAPSASGVPVSPGVAPAPGVDLAAIKDMIDGAIGAIQMPETAPPAPPAEPPVFNIHVDAPVINIPQQEPPQVTVNNAAPQITVESPTVNVEQVAKPEGKTVTTVLEHDEAGRIRKFEKVPVADDAAGA